MLRTFNCGVGMIVFTARADVARVTAALQGGGETVTEIGEIVARSEPDRAVIYRGTLGFDGGR
jgi:phosphoribosylformylglycinamidine cyclo-ligase